MSDTWGFRNRSGGRQILGGVYVRLGNVGNTSLTSKPFSTSTRSSGEVSIGGRNGLVKSETSKSRAVKVYKAGTVIQSPEARAQAKSGEAKFSDVDEDSYEADGHVRRNYRVRLHVKHRSTGGRNNQGRITCYHRGGGHKRRRRVVSFQHRDVNTPGVFRGRFYDPNRSASVALIEFWGKSRDGKPELEYRLYSDEESLDVGHHPRSSRRLSELAPHTRVHNIELVPGAGGQRVRAAGAFATVINQLNGYTRVQLPSGEHRLFQDRCRCNLGAVVGLSQRQKSLRLHRARKGKAGRSRWLGRRPTVRGTARNPVDHPHGGGQGKTSGGRPSVTPWSVPKGVRTSSGRGLKFVVTSAREHRLGRTESHSA